MQHPKYSSATFDTNCQPMQQYLCHMLPWYPQASLLPYSKHGVIHTG